MMGSPKSTQILSRTPSLSLSTSHGPVASQNGTVMYLLPLVSFLTRLFAPEYAAMSVIDDGLPPSKFGWSSRMGRIITCRLMAATSAACGALSGLVGWPFD